MGPVKLPRKALVAALVLSLVAAVFMTTVAPAISSAVLGVDSVSAQAHADEDDDAARAQQAKEIEDLKAQMVAEKDPDKKNALTKQLATKMSEYAAGSVNFSGCSSINVVCKGKKAVKDAAKGAFKGAAESIWQGFGRTLQLAMTWFIKIPTPKYQDYSVVQKIQAATIGLQFFGLVLSLIVIGFRLVMARRQAAVTEAEESVKSMAKAVFGAWTFGAVLLSLTVASDELSKWMLNQATEGQNAGSMLTMLMKTSLIGGFGAGLLFVVGVIGILGGLLQMILLVARQAMLAVVVSLVPVIGAFSGTNTGKQAFSKVMMWTVALLLWKPVAAAVYWVAFWMAGSDSKDAQQNLMGMILLSLAAAILPILVKLISGGAAMSSGSGAAAAGAIMGAVAAGGAMMATGGSSAGASAATASGGGGQSTATIAGSGGGGSQPGGGTGTPGGPSGGGPSGGDSGGGGSQPGGGTRGGGSAMVPPAPESDSSSAGGGGGGGRLSGGTGAELALAGAGATASSTDSFFDHDPGQSAGMGDENR
jgi:hypothetical protein